MKNIVLLSTAFLVVGLLLLPSCWNSDIEAHTLIPINNSPIPEPDVPAADDIILTPGGYAYRASINKQGVKNPFFPVETTLVKLSDGSNEIQIMYRENIVTRAGETRNNILTVIKENGYFENSSLDVYTKGELSGITLSRTFGSALPGVLGATLVMEIPPDIKPELYTINIGVEINGEDYGTIPCTVQVTATPVEDTTSFSNNYRSDANYLSVNLPDGWAAAEGPGHILELSHLEAQVSFNSWGEEDFWSREEKHGTASSYGPSTVMNSLPAGGAYIVLVQTNMPPPTDNEPGEYLQSDLCGLLTVKDWRLDSGFNNIHLYKWGLFLDIEIACDPAADDATVAQINNILQSWRFDEYPAGNVGWAIAIARELVPDTVQSFPRYTGSYSSGSIARNIVAYVGDDKTVHFRFTYHWDVASGGIVRDNMAASPQHWWEIDVLSLGVPVLVGEGGDELP